MPEPTERRPKILVTHRLHDEVRDRLAEYGELDMNTALDPWPQAEIVARARNAAAMMGFMTDCVDRAFLRDAPDLRVVACALKGFDSYDVSACTDAGVWISIVPDLLTEPTAELAIGLAISLGRHVRAADTYVRDGHFKGWRAQFYGGGLKSSIVAVIGVGQVGGAIIDRLSGFACERILGVDPEHRYPGAESIALPDAVAIADIVFVAAPLTVGSRHLINAATLARAKPGQLLVNVGRGSIVDETAVAQALESGRLAGYAADVFEFEDWALEDRPREIVPALRNHPNTLFTPHLGSAVRDVRRTIEQRAADNIIAVLAGREPPDAINRVGRPPRLV